MKPDAPNDGDPHRRRGGILFDDLFPPRGPGPHGRDRCRRCGDEAPPGRRQWCSEACRTAALEAHALLCDPAEQRRAVFRRDRGVCAACGRDALHLYRRLKATTGPEHQPARAALLARLRADGYTPHDLDEGALWHMDHVRPVADGGGLGGLDNLQTLCTPCHRKKTTAERRARRVRQQGLTDLFGPPP